LLVAANASLREIDAAREGQQKKHCGPGAMLVSRCWPAQAHGRISNDDTCDALPVDDP
jgi:hypothetical protein